VLDRDAPDEQVTRAAAANQTAWFERTAEAAGGTVSHEDGVTWTSAPGGAVFAFPQLSRERLDALLPRFLEDAAGAREASCWALLPTEPPELGAALLHVGFRDGWQAHWMAAPLGDAAEGPAPDDVRLVLDEGDWLPTDLPWDGVGATTVRNELLGHDPRRVWHVGAWRGDVPVGHATVSVTTGDLGVAGIYDMGVAEAARRRGIGKVLTRAVCALGRSAGCRVATLNATADGERLYRTVGFRSVGVAQTWWR